MGRVSKVTSWCKRVKAALFSPTKRPECPSEEGTGGDHLPAKNQNFFRTTELPEINILLPIKVSHESVTPFSFLCFFAKAIVKTSPDSHQYSCIKQTRFLST